MALPSSAERGQRGACGQRKQKHQDEPGAPAPTTTTGPLGLWEALTQPSWGVRGLVVQPSGRRVGREHPTARLAEGGEMLPLRPVGRSILAGTLRSPGPGGSVSGSQPRRLLREAVKVGEAVTWAPIRGRTDATLQQQGETFFARQVRDQTRHLSFSRRPSQPHRFKVLDLQPKFGFRIRSGFES